MICKICEQDFEKKGMEKHHLVPKKKRQKEFRTKIIDVCSVCGDQIHKLFTRTELSTEYNTLEKLKASSKIQKWVEWYTKGNRSVCMKKKKRR